MASHALYYDFVHKKITGKDFKLVLSNVLQATTSSNHFFRRGKRNTSKSSTIAARRERTRINVREHDPYFTTISLSCKETIKVY